MKSKENKFLKVNDGVVLDEFLDAVAVKLDKEFEAAGLHALLTSGIRTAEDQLRIIRQYLKQEGLHTTYPDAMSCKVTDQVTLNNEIVYVWQKAWSNLLNVGVIINPPLRAKLLMDYFVSAGVNRKGHIYEQTAHASKKCLDIGGAKNGINDEMAVLEKAMKNIPEIISLVKERKNNCAHINLKR